MSIDDSKKARSDLKKYFVKNAIPTEKHFAQLIDSALNQRDDGIVKPAGDAPLSIESVGGDKEVLNFYYKLADSDPAWSLTLCDPQTKRLGFTINNGKNNTRLCIDSETGNVGIGTTAPSHKLEVSGDASITGGLTVTGHSTGERPLTANRRLQIGGDGDIVAGIMLERSDGSPNAGYIRFGDGTGWKLHFGRTFGPGSPNTGATGILMTLNDNGNVHVSGGISCGGKISLAARKANDPDKYYVSISQHNTKMVLEMSNSQLKWLAFDKKSISPFEIIPILTRVVQEQQRTIVKLESLVKSVLRAGSP